MHNNRLIKNDLLKTKNESATATLSCFFLLFLVLISVQPVAMAAGAAGVVARDAVIAVVAGKVVESGAAALKPLWLYLRSDPGIYEVSTDVPLVDWSFTQRVSDDWKNESGPYTITVVIAKMQIDTIGSRIYRTDTTCSQYDGNGKFVSKTISRDNASFPVYLDNYDYYCKDGKTGYTRIVISSKLRVVVNTLRCPSLMINSLPIHTTKVAFNTKIVPKNCLDELSSLAYFTLDAKEKIQSVMVNYSPSAPFSFADVNPTMSQENTHGPLTSWFDYSK
jgi:hypothetical protein